MAKQEQLQTSAQAQVCLRKRILRAFVRCDLIEKVNAKGMLAYQHSSFSLDAGVCIEESDRAALERLLRYCARPPLAMNRLRKEGATLVYRCAKQHSEPTSDKKGRKVDELVFTPLDALRWRNTCPSCHGWPLAKAPDKGKPRPSSTAMPKKCKPS